MKRWMSILLVIIMVMSMTGVAEDGYVAEDALRVLSNSDISKKNRMIIRDELKELLDKRCSEIDDHISTMNELEKQAYDREEQEYAKKAQQRRRKRSNSSVDF